MRICKGYISGTQCTVNVKNEQYKINFRETFNGKKFTWTYIPSKQFVPSYTATAIPTPISRQNDMMSNRTDPIIRQILTMCTPRHI